MIVHQSNLSLKLVIYDQLNTFQVFNKQTKKDLGIYIAHHFVYIVRTELQEN